MKHPHHLLLSGVCLGLLSVLTTGCNQTTQTTSGRQYLDRYDHATGTGRMGNIDEEIRAVAAVEPILEFPARIGLARIENGRLSQVPEIEATRWIELAGDLGPGYGEFIPLSPLITEMVAGPAHHNARSANPSAATDIVNRIRLGAARQHLDAVLIYEVYASTSNRSLPSSILNWTLIGAYIVPSEKAEIEGFAQALLVDVRNGYPYGAAQASVSRTQVSTLVSSWDRRRIGAEETKMASAVQLAPEVGTMIRQLRMELAESRLNQL